MTGKERLKELLVEYRKRTVTTIFTPHSSDLDEPEDDEPEIRTDGGEPQESGTERSWKGGDATVWCDDGHDPKIVQHVAGTLYKCPHPDCDARYGIEVNVRLDPKDDGLRADGSGEPQETGIDRRLHFIDQFEKLESEARAAKEKLKREEIDEAGVRLSSLEGRLQSVVEDFDDWQDDGLRADGGPEQTGSDRELVYVDEAPKRVFGNVLIDGTDGQCVYMYAGIEQRCPKDPVAWTHLNGDPIEMCAEHCPVDVPEPPSTEQQELVTDGGQPSTGSEHWTDDYSREELIEKFARDTHQEVMISELSAFDEEDIRQEAEHHAGRAPELGDDAVDEIVERVQEEVADDLEREAEQAGGRDV